MAQKGGSLSTRNLISAAASLILLLVVWSISPALFGWASASTQSQARITISRIEPALTHKRGSIDYSRLDRRLRKLVAEDDATVGLAVGIVENGEIRFLKGYGETVARGREAVTPDTVFRWASVSKGVAADLIAKLAGEGRLSLNDPVARYSASLRLPEGSERQARVTDLLSHRLGLFAHANDARLEDGADPKQLRAELGALKSICPVGTCHSYQNVAYDTASEIVEKATGLTYERAVLEKLFRPLGMTSASLSREGLLRAHSWARPHRGGKTSKPIEVTQSYYHVPAAGGVNSSIKDMALWMRAQMGLSPNVLAPNVLAAVQMPRVVTPGERVRMRDFTQRLGRTSYGLGWRVYDYAGHTVIAHRGGVSGYRSLILFDPVRKTGVVALWNSSADKPGGLEFEVMDMVYRLPYQDWMKLDDKAPHMATRTADEAGISDAGS